MTSHLIRHEPFGDAVWALSSVILTLAIIIAVDGWSAAEMRHRHNRFVPMRGWNES